jgi:hypothetical protein
LSGEIIFRKRNFFLERKALGVKLIFLSELFGVEWNGKFLRGKCFDFLGVCFLLF